MSHLQALFPLQLRLVAAILVWALALNSTKWFEWRPVETCPPGVVEGKGMLKNLTEHRELMEQLTIDSLTGLGAKGLVNVSRNWDHVQNSNLKLTSTIEEVEEDCEVVPFTSLVS